MSRPRTESQPIKLSKLKDRPRTRKELRATMYSIRLAESEGLITPSGQRDGNSILWKLTRKGKNRAAKDGVAAPAHVPKSRMAA